MLVKNSKLEVREGQEVTLLYWIIMVDKFIKFIILIDLLLKQVLLRTLNY